MTSKIQFNGSNTADMFLPTDLFLVIHSTPTLELPTFDEFHQEWTEKHEEELRHTA